MADLDFLRVFTETPSVGTACRPVLNLLAQRFGTGYSRVEKEDAFCLFQKGPSHPSALETVLISHVDEIGGVAYGQMGDGGYFTRTWGNTPDIFANAELQAFDWLDESADGAFPVSGAVAEVDGEPRLMLQGDGIRPFRTAFTFRQETTVEGDELFGKALDPRVTAFAVSEAVLQAEDARVGVLFVLAEECAMDVARKAVTWLQANAPNVRLIINADVPELRNLAESRLDMPAIRIFEGRNFIDPGFGIRMSDKLQARGVEHHLTASRSGSQTLLFTPLAPTVSVALPSEGIHCSRYRMSLAGLERCTKLLSGLIEEGMS